MVTNDPRFFGTVFGWTDVRWAGNGIELWVYSQGDSSQADFIQALEERDFFEDINYSGFQEIPEPMSDEVAALVPSNATATRMYRINMRIKGGHIYDNNANRYGEQAYSRD
jgi:hypothetical protein